MGWRELTHEELVAPVNFDFEGITSTSDLLEDGDVIVGQKRALESLRFGLESDKNRFHIFVSGISGTGRTKLILRWIEKFARDKNVPDDTLKKQFAEVIKNGSKGKWTKWMKEHIKAKKLGSVEAMYMPPQRPYYNDKEIELIVNWLLSLRK